MIKVTNRFQPIMKNPKIKMPEIKFDNKIFGELTTAHSTDNYNPRWITTEIKNKFNKRLGYEILSFDKETKKGLGATLKVEKEYRQTNNRFGEILRLSSIMGILENGISEFEIHSKPTAIYFHSKYKFEPAIIQFEERDNALLAIIANSKEGYESFKEEAETLLEETYRNKIDEKQRALCKETNSLIKKYIQKALETKDEYKKHPFQHGIRMILTREKIIQNKDFFNSLFAKHGIDYKI